jgi:inosine-uridine nucleoside N-ribohydrolase
MAADPVRVILDCDTANEIDDQFAIAYALGCESLDVLGVVSVHNTLVHGPDSVAIYQEEAARVVELAGRAGLPCPWGAAGPMEDRFSPVRSEGLDFIIEAAHHGPVLVLATGPATDIAALGLVAPELRDRFEVIWAGAFPDEPTWQREKFGELNARADIQAWRALYASDLPLRILPGWPGVETVAVDWPTCVTRLQALDSPAPAYLAEILTTYSEARGEVLDMDKRDQQGQEKVIWDIVNVAAVHVPEVVGWVDRLLPTIDAAGAPDYSRPVRAVPLGLEVDAELVLEDMWRALGNLPRTCSDR